MDAEKMKRHISHLEEKHHRLDDEIDTAERIGYFNDDGISITDLKKERLHLRDEIERCKRDLGMMHG